MAVLKKFRPIQSFDDTHNMWGQQPRQSPPVPPSTRRSVRTTNAEQVKTLICKGSHSKECAAIIADEHAAPLRQERSIIQT